MDCQLRGCGPPLAQAAFFGGRIVHVSSAKSPSGCARLADALRLYAERELGDEPFAFDRRRLPFGANMAARVAVQNRYRFDPELGRRGTLLLAGEETALMEQWLSDGHVGMWVPQSRVDHIIIPDRLEIDYIRRFFFSLAESQLRRAKSDWLPVRFFRGGWYACLALKSPGPEPLLSPGRAAGRLDAVSQASQLRLGSRGIAVGQFPRLAQPAPLRRLEQCRGNKG